MAVTAIKTDIRNEILRILKEDINYQVQDGDGGKTIVPTAIIYQPTRAQKNREFTKSNQLTDVPGLLLCEPMRTQVDEPGGTNERDLWHYRWLVQLIDNPNWEQPGRIATWDKWNEQVMSAFMFAIFDGVVTLPKGQVWWSRASGLNDIDENIWVRDGKFISGVEIEVKVLQPRGIVA